MIVDDSRVARLALARRLGARGIEVASVASGADALRKLQETRPDVVFMDYMMPEMDGLEACRAIVNNPATSTIPVIMTTSNDTPEFRKRGLASGAKGFLSKGLEDRELDNVLDSASEAGRASTTTRGAAVESNRAELDEQTLALIRDQAINAARRASEEYFTGQLPGLEEQVIQVAESAARQAVSGAASAGGAGAVDDRALQALQQRVDNIYNDKQLRTVVQRIVREEGLARSSAGSPPLRRDEPRSGGFGRFLRNLFVLAVLVVGAYFAVVLLFPDSPLATQLQSIVESIFGRR